ncbi:MAG: hypothetical protein RXR16_08700, partial [Thermocladium sp.]
LLWMLGIGLIIGKNLTAMNHALWFTGIFFALITIETAKLGLVTLSIALGLLPLVTNMGVKGAESLALQGGDG